MFAVDIITIDIDSWAQDQGLVCNQFWGKVVSDNKYDGWELSVVGDPRDFMDDLYQLEAVEKPGNRFIFKKPYVDGPHWRDMDIYIKQQREYVLVEGRKVALNQFMKLSKEEKQASYEVVFPEGMKLSDKLFLTTDQDTDELVVDSKLIAGKYKLAEKKVKDQTVDIKNRCTILTWRLCDIATKRNAGTDENKKSKAEEQLDDILAGDSD